VEPTSETIPAPRVRLSADGTTANAGTIELKVSDATELGANGATVTVTGRGYDEFKGVYVAFCKQPRPGRVPSPCGGGAATEGSTGASQWISSNPPPYGRGLAVPYETDGAFETTLRVEAKLSPKVDCRNVQCVVVTRNDHTRTTDRSQDVFVPVTFTGSRLDDGGGSASGDLVIPVVVGGAIVVAAIAGGVLLARRRRRDRADATVSTP
jgi:hypothetical protein